MHASPTLDALLTTLYKTEAPRTVRIWGEDDTQTAFLHLWTCLERKPAAELDSLFADGTLGMVHYLTRAVDNAHKRSRQREMRQPVPTAAVSAIRADDPTERISAPSCDDSADTRLLLHDLHRAYVMAAPAIQQGMLLRIANTGHGLSVADLRVIATLRQLVSDQSFCNAATAYFGANDVSTLQPQVRRTRTDGTWASAGTVANRLRAADNAIRIVFELPPLR